MNTKQVEELTGISRQNIRYYERQGLLKPERENGNAYRDYSEDDIQRLKLIKMLRMLDMPLKEIEHILKEEISLKEAAARQQEILQKQQEQLQAAIEVCASIHKEHAETIDVDRYLQKMENMSQNGGMFAKIVDDYKLVAFEEEQRQFSFYTEYMVNTAGEFEDALREYAAKHHKKFKLIKGGMYPEFTMDGEPYTAVRIVEAEPETKKEISATRIICKREFHMSKEKEISVRRRKVFRGIHSIRVNIQRHRWKSILNVMVSMLVVVVMAFYMGNISSIEHQIDELPEKLSVTGQVWNKCGKASSGLFIPQKIVDAVHTSPYVEDVAESSELNGRTIQGGQYQLWGMNRMECIDGLLKENITWVEGWDWQKFQASEKAGLVSEKFLQDNELKTGEEVEFSLSRYKMDTSGMALVEQELLPTVIEVAGVVDLEKLSAKQSVPDVILPLNQVKQIYEENKILYNASSLSFQVKNPMKLNAFKQEMKDAGVQNVEIGAQEFYTGESLKIADAIFIQAVTSLEKSLSLMKGFLPFVLLVVVMLGYIVPHLLFQGRREEYAIMRALGTGKWKCSALFFVEHILLASAGSGVGMIAGVVCGAIDISSGFAVWAAFLGCYACGAAAALWMFGRFSVAAVLSHRD